MAQENPYPRLVRAKPPLSKRILARLFGRVKYFLDREHFKQPTWVYLCYCKEHKVYFEDYLHGHLEYVVCPVCWWEEHWDDFEDDWEDEEALEEALEELLEEEYDEEEELW